MQLKWLVFAVLVAGASAATIHHRRTGARDIPVQVVYDAPNVRNLEEKPQVETKPTGIKNLEAKPQLSTEDIKDIKQLPTPVDEANKVKIVTPDTAVEVIQQPLQPAVSAAYQQGEEQNIDDIYDKIQEIINNGAKKIQADFEKIPENSQKQEVLAKVNSTFEEFLESTKKLIALRNVQTLKQDTSATTSSPIPNPANIFQQIINSFQTFSSNLFSGLNPAQTQSEGTTAGPGGFPNPAQIAQGVFNQIQGSLGSLFGARPPNALGDETPNSPAPQNPLQFIQQQFSNIFNRPTTAAPGNQADEQATTQSTNPIVGFVQGAISNVQNAFNPSTAAPAAHDEVTQGTANAAGNPLNVFQQAGQNILQAVQNNPFFPASSTAAPAALAGSSTAAPNQAAAAITNAQNQLSQAIPNNPFQQPAQQAIAAGSSGANQVVSQLAQQGVPIPEQVNSAINAAQQAAGESSTAAPAAVEAPAETVPKQAPVKEEISNEVSEKKTQA